MTPQELMAHKTTSMFQAIDDELQRARKKFPSANLSFVALVEEVGELAQALLKLSAGRNSKSIPLPDLNALTVAMVDEAIQVATMAIRVATEPDDTFTGAYSEPDSVNKH